MRNGSASSTRSRHLISYSKYIIGLRASFPSPKHLRMLTRIVKHPKQDDHASDKHSQRGVNVSKWCLLSVGLYIRGGYWDKRYSLVAVNVQACYLKKNSRAIDLQYFAWNMLVDILCTVYCDYFKAPGRLTWFPYPTSWINVNVFNVTLVEWCFIGCHQRYISYGLDDLQRIMTQFSGTHYVSWTKHMVLLYLFLVSLSPVVNSLDACVDIL